MLVGLGRIAESMGLSSWLRDVLSKFFAVLRRRSGNLDADRNDQFSLVSRFIFQDGHYRKQAPAKRNPMHFFLLLRFSKFRQYGEIIFWMRRSGILAIFSVRQEADLRSHAPILTFLSFVRPT